MVRYLFYTIGDLTYQSPLVAGHISPFIEMEMLIQYESHRPLLKCTRKCGEGMNN